MSNKTKMTASPAKSPRYFFGRLLNAEDLRNEQPYIHLVCGVVRGVVTNNVDPAGASRVEITVPTVTNDPLWAPLVHPSGTAPAIPEIGRKVAVAFEEGDIQRPLVLGLISGT